MLNKSYLLLKKKKGKEIEKTFLQRKSQMVKKHIKDAQHH